MRIHQITCRGQSILRFVVSIAAVFLTGGARAEVLFSSDGSSVGAFPCKWDSGVTGVQPADGNPSPSIEFGSGASVLTAPYSFPLLTVAQSLHGSIDVRSAQPSGYVWINFAATQSSTCTPEWRYALPYISWRTSDGSLTVGAFDASGAFVGNVGSVQGAGAWHTFDWLVTPDGVGGYRFVVKCDGVIVGSGASNAMLATGESVAVEIGIGSRYEPDHLIRYDNVLLEVVDAVPVPPAALTFPFAGMTWQAWQMGRYGSYQELSADDVVHSEAQVGIATPDEYAFRGIKTVSDLPEESVTATVEMWRTGNFNWQSYPFSIILPFATFSYYNYGSRWGLDTVTETGEWYQTGARHYFPLPAALPGVHYFVKLEYSKESHSIAAWFREGAGEYQEIFRGISHWGLAGVQRGEGAMSSKIVLESSDNRGATNYSLIWEPRIPPALELPQALVAEATDPEGADVLFAASARDSTGTPLVVECTPASGHHFPLGQTSVECAAVDASGLRGVGTFPVTVRDTTPPVLSVPDSAGAEGSGPTGAIVEFSVSATDLVDETVPVSCSPAPGSQFPMGSTTVTCSAVDEAGNSEIASFAVTVRDSLPPAITSLVASPSTLWPPNGKMVPVDLSAVVTDLVDAFPAAEIIAVSGDDGSTPADWQITGPLSAKLRAARTGGGNGRTYSLTIQVIDHSGNASLAVARVVVPHNR